MSEPPDQPSHTIEDELASGVVCSIDGFELDRPRVTVGRADADLTLTDSTVSRLHAALERVTGGWIVQDLGSRNGTYVNGARLLGPRALRHGDEIRFGGHRVVFRNLGPPSHTFASLTSPLEAPPRLTPREHDLLIALCRPLLEGSMLAEPASVREIAAELVVTESGAKKLLARAFDRFDLQGDDRRRPRLALAALRRGAVTVADVEQRHSPTTQSG